jgi:hypothetical protein
MGASADAYVIIGFEVDHSDFWTEQITKGTKPECSNGHPGKTGKYCQDCGELIEIQVESKTIPTPNFAKYCKDRNLDPEEVYVPDDPAYLEEAIDPSGFDGLELYCIDAYTDHDTDKETIALGVQDQQARREGNPCPHGQVPKDRKRSRPRPSRPPLPRHALFVLK